MNTTRYTEILKLAELLDTTSIPYSFEPRLDGYQIKYGEDVSIIQNEISYGSDENLLELMGLLNSEELLQDSVVGWLTAEEVFNRIKKHYKANNR